MRAAPVALLVLLAPLADAGSESDPELRDSGDSFHPTLDILAAWLEHDPRGVRFTVKVETLERGVLSRLYELGWRTGLSDDESVAVGFDGEGRLRSSLDTPSGWSAPGGRSARLDDALLDENAAYGSPGYIGAVVPMGAGGIEEGARMRELVVRSTYYDRDQERWVLGMDEATSARTFVVGDAGERGLTRAHTILAILAFGALGGLLGWLGLRRRRSP